MQQQLVKEYLDELKLPSFRYRQILKNYYSGRYLDFNGMSDLPKALRDQLNGKFKLMSVAEDKLITGRQTQKARLVLSDGLKIESVLMDYRDWLTVCVSSQVGCPLNCAFCATGKMGFKRNLSAEEILDQILYWNHQLHPKYVGRVVFMGMGEPFLNWDNFRQALDILHDPTALNIGMRKMSVSTAGIVPKIKELADLKLEINLAISLHSANQSVREKIMPIARQYPLNDLKDACLYYAAKTNRQLFFEYALISGINDSTQDLNNLISWLKLHRLFYLNLIPLNNIQDGPDGASRSAVSMFENSLIKHHIPYSVRQSFGQEIGSACGQLTIKNDAF